MLLEDHMPKKILEVHEAESVAIKRYIRDAPNFLSDPKKMSHSLRSKSISSACWCVEDMTMVEVVFCREDILASSPSKKLYLVWNV